MSYRPAAPGMHAMVSSGNALASIVGLQVLREGGNAVDAVIATNAALQVTSPFVCGLGGDLFALVYDAKTGQVHGFNGSGRSANAVSLERVRAQGYTVMPRLGGLTVTVPGAVDAWAQLHERFGSRPWADLFGPAIEYARDGHPAGRGLSRQLMLGGARYGFDSWKRTFTPEGRAPKPGEVWRQHALASSLERVQKEGRAGLYEGPLARAIVDEVHAHGGALCLDDLKAHRGEWASPVSTTYRGHTVYQSAPNSQGMAALIALNLLEDVDLTAAGPGAPQTLTYLIEAARYAYADRDRYLTDPDFAEIPTAYLLDKQRAKSVLTSGHKHQPTMLRAAGDTTSFSVVDPMGNAVSCIQSNYGGFGSGLAVGGFGLQNRGAYFSLDPAHINRLEPGKRTLHTIMAGVVMDGVEPWILFGAVGGDTQPQTHLQVLTNLIDHGMDIQAAIEAPRFVLGAEYGGSLDTLQLESRFPEATAQALRAAGYPAEFAPSLDGMPGWSAGFGYGQGIVIDPASGALFGGADPRWDAYAVGW
ncbi:MAG: gamma-glutamyltransferase [Chloroflexi bacterium]|nr:gamma-glutamyltransferase [Chloroflexota bacterium]